MFDRTCGKCGAGLRARDQGCRNCNKTVTSAKTEIAKPTVPKRHRGDSAGIRIPAPVAEVVQSPALVLASRASEPAPDLVLDVPAEKPKKGTGRKRAAKEAPAPLPLEVTEPVEPPVELVAESTETTPDVSDALAPAPVEIVPAPEPEPLVVESAEPSEPAPEVIP
jgi:hypothetical protein